MLRPCQELCVCVCRKQKMLRCVVREDLSFEMATDLVNDMKQVIEWLDHHFIYSGQTFILGMR